MEKFQSIREGYLGQFIGRQPNADKTCHRYDAKKSGHNRIGARVEQAVQEKYPGDPDAYR